MRAKDLILRCYAERSAEECWEAFCLDLSLAARGAMLEEARTHLKAQIHDYLNAALADEAHAADLVPRPAPPSEWLRYAMARFLGGVTSFRLPLPLVPAKAA